MSRDVPHLLLTLAATSHSLAASFPTFHRIPDVPAGPDVPIVTHVRSGYRAYSQVPGRFLWFPGVSPGSPRSLGFLTFTRVSEFSLGFPMFFPTFRLVPHVPSGSRTSFPVS